MHCGRAPSEHGAENRCSDALQGRLAKSAPRLVCGMPAKQDCLSASNSFSRRKKHLRLDLARSYETLGTFTHEYDQVAAARDDSPAHAYKHIDGGGLARLMLAAADLECRRSCSSSTRGRTLSSTTAGG